MKPSTPTQAEFDALRGKTLAISSTLMAMIRMLDLNGLFALQGQLQDEHEACTTFLLQSQEPEALLDGFRLEASIHYDLVNRLRTEPRASIGDTALLAQLNQPRS